MYRIFDNISYEILNEGEKFEIAGIEYDSRKIRENFVFIAMTGNNVDGHDFIQKAIDSGAKMIVAEKRVNVSGYSNYEKVSFILIENIRKSSLLLGRQDIYPTLKTATCSLIYLLYIRLITDR